MQDAIQIPQSPDTERALLGAILIDPSLLDKVMLEPDDFYLQKHKILFRRMRALGTELDVVSLGELSDRNNDPIGITEMIRLSQECPNAYNWNRYEKIIKDTSIRRKVIRVAEELANLAFKEDKPLDSGLSEIMSKLAMVSDRGLDIAKWSDYIKMAYERFEARLDDPKNVYGLATGLTDFDTITHGLQKRETFILAGTPGSGKSMLSVQLAEGMAKNGHSGVIFQLEMAGEAMARRRLSASSGVPMFNILSGINGEERVSEIIEAIGKIDTPNLSVVENSEITTVQMRAILSRLKAQENIEFFVVDYLDLLSDNFGGDSVEKSAYLSQQTHAIAKDLNLAGLVIQSLNKQGYSGGAGMQHLSGSAKVSYDADQIAILDREGEDEIVTLRWRKVREGNSNQQLRLRMKPGLPEFVCLAREERRDEWTDI